MLKKIYQTDTFIAKEFFVEPLASIDHFVLTFEEKDKEHVLLNLKEWVRQIEQES